MRNKRYLIQSAITSLLTLTTTITTTSALAAATQTEKCYGIVKAAANDCQTATSTCAGSSTKDGQRDAFIFLPKGTCEKIVGGHLKDKGE